MKTCPNDALPSGTHALACAVWASPDPTDACDCTADHVSTPGPLASQPDDDLGRGRMSRLPAVIGPLWWPASLSGVTDWGGCSHSAPDSCRSCDGTGANDHAEWLRDREMEHGWQQAADAGQRSRAAQSTGSPA